MSFSPLLPEGKLPEWNFNRDYLNNSEYQYSYNQLIRALSTQAMLRSAYIHAVMKQDVESINKMILANQVLYPIVVLRIEEINAITQKFF